MVERSQKLIYFKENNTIDNVPLLKDLYEHITPQYAADWKVIGVLLDLPAGEIRAIEAGNPTNTKWCCNSMLEYWLEVDTSATWRKMFCAIESPAVSSTYNSDYLDEIYQNLNSSKSPIANKTPLLKELYEHITPQFAADWKVIGSLLGLPSGELKAIAAGNPTNVKWCCNTMLERWLDVDRTATWKKILVAINSPALSSSCNSDFMYRDQFQGPVLQEATDMTTHGDAEVSEAVALVLDCLGRTYIVTRFNTDKDTWPPQQSKHFTTLAFIYHYKNERTQREVITIAKASQSGHIDDIMQAAGSCENSATSEDYDLEGYSATKDISELLAPLDHSDGSKPQTILIEGAPGIGKSFLLKHIAYLWAEKHVLFTSKLLSLLCLRDPAVQKMSSVNDLVNYFCKQEKTASNLGHICAAYLYKTGGKNVTILLDGLDEFPEELHDNSFIVNILEHRVLSSCNVIVSSRPHASAHLHDNVMLRVDILGFTEKDRECFIKQSFIGKPEKIKKLLVYLQGHPTVNSLCFIPFIMTVLVFLYKHEVVLFDSVSELYMQFVCLTIRRHLTKLGFSPKQDINDFNKLPGFCSNIIRDLSRLSLKALSKNQLIFSLDEIKMACPEIENARGAFNGFGLLQAVEHFSATCKTISFNFIHFSIQEFLAAQCVVNLPPKEEVQVLENYFWSKRYFNMFLMYIGLTRGQRSSFRQFLSDGDTQTRIADKFLTEQKRCLYLYKCFCEAGDNEMCQVISESKVFSGRTINLRGIPLLPNDVSCLGLFLANSHIKHWKRLELLSCNIRDVGCRILHHALVGNNISVTIENLHLSANSLTSVSAHYISDIAVSCKSTLLYLNGNVLGNTDGLSRLLQDTAMVELYIHGNKLHTSSVISLFKALQNCSSKLKMLSLIHNDIRDEAGVEIATALQVNRTLECLWINGNPISGETALTISAALRDNNTLKLLELPYYSYDLRKTIAREAKDINEIRRSQGSYMELTIDFQ